MFRIASILMCACVLATPAAWPAGAAEAGVAANSTNGIVDVELPAFFAPMVVNSRLESYAYISVALTPSAANTVFTIREKVPFLRDAFLRELNKASIVKASAPTEVDAAAVKARLMARAEAVLPPDTISDLKLEQIVVAPLQAGS
jgi:hypothetical protein